MSKSKGVALWLEVLHDKVQQKSQLMNMQRWQSPNNKRKHIRFTGSLSSIDICTSKKLTNKVMKLQVDDNATN